MIKEQLKQNIESNKQGLVEKVKKDVEYVKLEKKEQRDLLQLQR